MYWGQAKSQVTVHSGIIKLNGNESYHPHFSNDYVHDKVFVYLVFTEMLTSVDVESGRTIIITCDNCTCHYKSACNFFD